ncbi:Phosphoribosylpyrophosphate synthetase [Halanaeroarchaeum sp. HSR-CO]|uniref:ribose-phosphate diphosphokinase n=1 Tax=Halanaeroarchaeum sp. HSR-CO TaxID=2866382 RepID=UPI00217D39B8|nr:ribose-phosphate diphosphokinase [Halanaeroarchaeum sp. HSR-CO]UWG46505.1 Phosphoribosylpyrophosphate synthetase [Halanaeroarchaeum sp. HSR-CO]
MIVSTSDSQAVAAALAEATGDSLAETAYERFPDGELLVEVPPVDGRAVVVGSTISSDAHLELLLLQDAVREAGADEVVTVLPYMGYARQDEAFSEGQPVSARAVARAISPTTDRVVAVNLHEPAIADFFDVPVDAVDAAGVLADPLPSALESPVFLSPDEGAIDLAETVRDARGEGAVDYFEKDRDYDTGAVTITPSEVDVSDRDVVVVDDIVATGSTMSEAIAILQERGPNRVFVATVHPLFVGNARSKLANAGVEAVLGTDTIERAVSRTSVAPVIAEVL